MAYIVFLVWAWVSSSLITACALAFPHGDVLGLGVRVGQADKDERWYDIVSEIGQHGRALDPTAM